MLTFIQFVIYSKLTFIKIPILFKAYIYKILQLLNSHTQFASLLGIDQSGWDCLPLSFNSRR